MTDDKIVKLVSRSKVASPPPEIDDLQEELIAHLEELVERAKKGEIVGLAYVADIDNPLVMETHFFCRKVFQTIGGVEALKKDLLDQIE